MRAQTLRFDDLWLACALLLALWAVVGARKEHQRRHKRLNRAESLKANVERRGFRTTGGPNDA